ncbi:ADP-ribosylglycohydrolase family protein [Spirulina subsalsa FACHB-351]|uniref:ADP-ribosylglycohydrolase family protein n=1 Tax=Spirulina subsalsa FACHB-351 TaxID=234711 RepID=A0ABT3LDD1_9CYAN|nr:ADP-ribosylglycohydrolase family protein [Spirulina subsalsa]MCW6038995.1 ADP-ribosylglycohydrolase family protein [Spirulina subsalsa FACHB-351]
MSLDDRALGCVLGALVGDAAGATLEFLGHLPSPRECDRALTLPGGGILGVAPGQITDDGELTLCLAQALATSPRFNLTTIIQHYLRWYDSHPFEIGQTTATALRAYQRVKSEDYPRIIAEVVAPACSESKANGSVMRATPLAVWGYDLGDEELARYAIADSAITHPHPSCGYGVACYCLAIAHLLKNDGDSLGAFQRAEQWLNIPKSHPSAQQEVLSWLNDAQNNHNIPYSPHIGFIKIALTHAFRHLLHCQSYLEAIQKTLPIMFS